MPNRALRARLRWVEVALWATGVALLTGFAMLRVGQAQQKEEGLAEFYAVKAESPNSTPVAASPATSPAPQPVLTDPYASKLPDQSLWSPQRIEAFSESRHHVAETPRGVLRVDRLDIEVPVYNGASDLNLDRGVARIAGTAGLYQAGNLGIAGHRDGFFRPLKDIQAGDVIVLETRRGTSRYRVSEIVITDPSDVSVLSPTDEATLTLVTCYPFYFVGHAPKRFIVKARAEQFLAMN